MLHDEYLNVLKKDYMQHGSPSLRKYAASLMRSLRGASRLVVDESALKRVEKKGQPEIIDWSMLADQMPGTDDNALHMPEMLVEKLAGMKLPGGLLWIEQEESPSDDEEYREGISAILLEEVEEGIAYSYFMAEDFYHFLPHVTVIFQTSGEVDIKLTASGVSELRENMENGGSEGVLADSAYYQGKQAGEYIWEYRNLLAAAWMACSKDPLISGAVQKPVAKATQVPRIRSDIKAIHPNRFLSDFPGIEDAAFGDLSGIPAFIDNGVEGLLEEYRQKMSVLAECYPAWLGAIPVEKQPESSSIVMRGLQGMLNTLSGFKRSGSHVFHLNGDLSTLLAQTEMDGLMCDDIRPPYNDFYLSYEEKIPFSANDERLIFEGTYIRREKDDNSLHFTMIISPEKPEGQALADFRHPIEFSLQMEPDISLEQALINAVESNDYDTEKTSPPAVPEDAARMAAEMGIELRAVDKTSTTLLAEMHESSFNSVAECLRVVGNSLILLTDKPEQITGKEEWVGASDAVKYQLDAPSKKGRERGRKMAMEEGCLPIRMLSLDPSVAASIRETREEDAEANRGGSPSVAYWRTGHWRWQPYGPRNSLRRWKWIEPKLCNEKAPLIAAGSHYENRREDTSDLEP